MWLVRPSKDDPTRLEIRWDILPMFIAVQGDLHIQLAQDLNREFAGVLTTSDAHLQQIHVFVCSWLQDRFPMYLDLQKWLSALHDVQEQ
jgi:hypothetical protein